MRIVTATDNLADLLRDCQDVAEIRDENGATLGFFEPLPIPNQGQFVKSPYSVEELQELRKQRSGKPLAEILARLRDLAPRGDSDET
jgi:hypothetical protein